MPHKKGNTTRAKPEKFTNPIFHLYCDGQRTEPDYFLKGLKGLCKDLSLKIKDSGKDFKTLLEKARLDSKCNKDGHNEGNTFTWFISDREVSTIPGVAKNPEKIKKLIEEAHKEGFKVAVSNPCFEIWLLMHLDKVSSAYKTTDKCIEELAKKLNGYDCKNKGLTDAQLKQLFPDKDKYSKLRKAISNASKLDPDDSDFSIIDKTGSRVYKLIEAMGILKASDTE